ncbi:MAG: tetratricopeptide repeat protein, partial [Candidatus Aminicenantes bacterium]|nr:tetratricopeptide repeat protein [Candidatus Aminicenantes bacterium]
FVYNYLAQKQYDLAQQELDKAVALNLEDRLNPVYHAVIIHYRGELEKAEKEYLQLGNHPEPGIRYFAANGVMDIHLIKGQFSQAKMITDLGVASVAQLGVNWVESEWRAQLAYFHLRSKNPKLALKESELAWSAAAEVDNYDKMRMALLFKGLSYIGLNDLEKAQAVADELRTFIEEGMNPKIIRLFHFLQGRIEMSRGNWGKAIENLEQAVSNRNLTSFHPLTWLIDNQHIWHLYSLASAYFQVQDYTNALEMSERALSLNFNKIGYGDVLSKCHYLKGKIYQEQGLTAQAVASYEQFLDLWKDADSGLPELTDAQSQLAALR